MSGSRSGFNIRATGAALALNGADAAALLGQELAAYSLFFVQCLFFVESASPFGGPRHLERADAVRMGRIPCGNHIRQMPDGVTPEHFDGVFSVIVTSISGGRCAEAPVPYAGLREDRSQGTPRRAVRAPHRRARAAAHVRGHDPHLQGVGRCGAQFPDPLKGRDIRVRPVHHRDERRVRAHPFLCLPADAPTTERPSTASTP